MIFKTEICKANILKFVIHDVKVTEMNASVNNSYFNMLKIWIDLNTFFVGSMKGRRIKNAKETLTLFLKSLPLGCLFNVVSFGSRYICLFEQ